MYKDSTTLIILITNGIFSAEGEGFKPPIPERGIPDFESSAFGHSANLPCDCKSNKKRRFYKIKKPKLSPNKFIQRIISAIYDEVV